MRIKWGKIFLAFLVIWILILLYLFMPLWQARHEQEELLASKLKSAQEELEKLTNENYQLKTLLKKYQGSDADNDDPQANIEDEVKDFAAKLVKGPSLEYEQTRRQIMRDTNEFWWYVRSRLEEALKKSKNDKDLSDWINVTLTDAQHHQKAVLVDLEHLADVDGHADWRLQEAKELEALVQKRITTLQNPDNCATAKKLLCNLNKGCGYGCQLHHAVYCFIVAYGTERTLILKSKGWRYNRNGYEEIFQPLSETCREPSGQKNHWPGSKDSMVVEIPIIDSINPRPRLLPPAIPKDLSDRILRIHGDPIVWWVSQFLKYLLRPQAETAKMLADAEKDQGLTHPVVGVHVRRTDKVGTEAAFHSVEEYMKYVSESTYLRVYFPFIILIGFQVDEYYDKLELKEGKIEEKKVYVATDDPKVLAECRKKFPQYVFIGDQKVSKSAAVSTRYSSNSLKGIITDIHMLSRTDYLVCTFSSQVCRVAYEIMQYLKVDASDNFKSLDDIWYFGGQDEHQQVAVMEHKPGTRDEIELKVGDVVGVAGNHWNGFNKGRNHRTNRIGLYPQYKTREKVKLVDFPTYAHVEL